MTKEAAKARTGDKAAPRRLHDMLGYHLRRASALDMKGVAAALEPAGARPVTLSILRCIVERPGVSSVEICRLLGLQRANLAPLLAELEQRGLFLRETDPSDHRVQRLRATRKGEAEAALWLDLAATHEEEMLRGLSAEERAELRRLLAKLWRQDEPGED